MARSQAGPGGEVLGTVFPAAQFLNREMRLFKSSDTMETFTSFSLSGSNPLFSHRLMWNYGLGRKESAGGEKTDSKDQEGRCQQGAGRAVAGFLDNGPVSGVQSIVIMVGSVAAGRQMCCWS